MPCSWSKPPVAIVAPPKPPCAASKPATPISSAPSSPSSIPRTLPPTTLTTDTATTNTGNSPTKVDDTHTTGIHRQNEKTQTPSKSFHINMNINTHFHRNLLELS